MSESKDRRVDFLIVGHGIAGALLSYQLRKRGKAVMVIDQTRETAASRVAAGVINPVTGRRYVKSWLFDELWPLAQEVYRDLEQALNTRFFYPRFLLRGLATEAEVKRWRQRMVDPAYQPFIDLEADAEAFASRVHPPHRYGRTRIAAQVDLPTLLDAQADQLRDEGAYRAEEFRYSELNIRPENGVRYRDVVADTCVFCEGAGGKSNPFFNYLPFRGAKGEVLIVRIPGQPFSQMLKQRLFIVPLPDDRYWIGSFYEHDYTHDRPTASGKAYLADRLKDMLQTDFEIMEQKAAIRPTVEDRRPFLGRHPEFSQLALFNGLGTKGASLAPYFSDHLARHLLTGQSLLEAVDIRRFA